ncbi:MAG TPA: Fe-S cluster assembly protein SufD [Gemmatimonadaceae bacterium]|nr:Fe-S cluster assembly protein SufD [Gemmatimonadaceae bacterium]
MLTAKAAASRSAPSLADDFAAFVKEARGPRWLRKAREAGLERFERLGFPTPRDEDWHYTSVAPIAEAGFRVVGEPGGEVDAADLSPYTFGRGSAWPTLVYVNGRYSAALSHLDGLSSGVRVMDLATALDEEESLVEGYLTKLADDEARSFTALNTAFLRDGAVVHVAKEAEVATPIHLLFVTDSAGANNAAHVRNLIVAERHSKVTVVESYVALGEARYFTNAVTEVSVGDGATVSHYKVQRESRRAFHVGTTEVTQGRDSHYVSFSFAVGAALSRTNVYTVLAGEGCGSTLNGLYMVDGEQHVDHQTRIEHAQPNCFSREVYKGILDGSSRGVFNGKVYVHPIAQKTDGKQSNNNLLLSERAHVDTKPQLEIFADDVKCTHGATVGRLDETALFYMKSRGVNRELARRLLTYAFAADVLETIELAEVRDELESLTLARFTTEEGVGDRL